MFDQAIYAKAMDIVIKRPDEFSSVVLHLGAFHICCTFLAIIGKRFGDAGLFDILVESGVGGGGQLLHPQPLRAGSTTVLSGFIRLSQRHLRDCVGKSSSRQVTVAFQMIRHLLLRKDCWSCKVAYPVTTCPTC